MSLTPSQRVWVDQAREKLAAANANGAQGVADLWPDRLISGDVYAFAAGVMTATAQTLLEVIDELTGGQS